MLTILIRLMIIYFSVKAWYQEIRQPADGNPSQMGAKTIRPKGNVYTNTLLLGVFLRFERAKSKVLRAQQFFIIK